MPSALDRARLLIAETAAIAPAAVRLARVLSLATRIEPVLLRTARLECCPDLDAGAEADFWFSLLVQTCNPLLAVLDPDVAAVLREELARDPQALAVSWDVLARVHAEAPPVVRLEEEVTWLALSGLPDAEARMQEKLLSVFQGIAEGREGLRHWAVRALPRLPEAAHQTDASRLLTLSTGGAVSGGTLSLDALPRTSVGVRRLAEAVEIGSPDVEGAHVLELPGTTPLVLDVAWTPAPAANDAPDVVQRATQAAAEGAGTSPLPRTERIVFGRSETRRIKVGTAETVTLTTLLGEVATLRITGPDHDAEPTYWTVPFERDSGFIGREHELRMIRDAFLGANTVGLVGPAGIGKTAIALEYAYRHRDAYSAVFWITDPEDEGEVLEAVARATGHRGHRAGEAWLRDHENALVVLDGASTTADLSVLQNDAHHVLSTARGESAEESQGRWTPGYTSIPIPPLPVEEAVALLAERMSNRGVQVAEKLEGHPYALVLIRAFVQRQRLSWEEAGARVFTADSTGVDAALYIALRTLTREERSLLDLSALFGEIALPEAFVRRGLPHLEGRSYGWIRNASDLEGALRYLLDSLEQLRLIQRSAEPSPSYRLHAPVIDFVLRQLDASEDLWDERAARLAERALATTPEYEPDWPVIVGAAEAVTSQAMRENRGSPHVFTMAGQLIPLLAEEGHIDEARRLLDYMEGAGLQGSEASVPIALARGALRLATHDARGAVDAFNEAQSWDERSSEGPRPGIEIPLGLGRAYTQLGELEAAQEHLDQALSIARRREDQVREAAALYRIAELERKRENWSASEAFGRQALEVVESRYSPEHPHVASTLYLLGQVLLDRGDAAQAEGVFRRALAIAEQADALVLLPEILLGLGRIARERKQPEEATRWYSQALALMRDTLPEDHPDVAHTLGRIGQVQFETGDFANARATFEQALALEGTYGGDNPSYPLTLQGLSRVLAAQGEVEGAKAKLEEALDYSVRQVGEQHGVVGSLQLDLSRVSERLGDIEGAIHQAEQATLILGEAEGFDHPEALEARAHWWRLQPSSFISYARPDYELAERLVRDLRQAGVRCWMDVELSAAGESYQEVISTALSTHQYLALLITEASGSSSYVKREAEIALQQEGGAGRIIPLAADELFWSLDSGWTGKTGWVAILQRQQPVDFRQWRDEKEYRRAFGQLLARLRTTPDGTQPDERPPSEEPA